jgi:putative ABC transport system substrate-binding protein
MLRPSPRCAENNNAVLIGFFRSLLEAMREMGWIEGQNFVFEIASAEGKQEQLPAAAAALVRLKVDVILVNNTPQTIAAKEATSTIPIVMAVVGDAVESGLLSSLTRPGGNVTGLSTMFPELAAKRLALLKESRARDTGTRPASTH